MGAAMVLEENVQAVQQNPVRDYAHLRPYQFQKGHAPAGPGRPKGMKNALTVILDAAPKKAKQYVRSTAPAVLVDARKWIMPIESDAPAPATVNLVQLLTQRYQSPAPLLREGAYSPPVSAATTPASVTHESGAATEPGTGSGEGATGTPPLGQ